MLIDNVSEVLKPTHVSFECLRDKIVNLFFTGLASGINTGRVRYLPSNGKIVVLGLVRREFRHESKVPMVGSSDIGREFRRIALN